MSSSSRRVILAPLWEPGGDVIHYQNGNNRDDIPVRFTVTMLGQPGKPMLTLVDDEELARRKNRRHGAGKRSRGPFGMEMS